MSQVLFLRPSRSRLQVTPACVAGLLLAVILSAVATDLPDSLKALRGVYEKQLQLIEEESVTCIHRWPERYVSKLKAFQIEAQKRGDFDTWRLAQTELDRFQAERGMKVIRYGDRKRIYARKQII